MPYLGSLILTHSLDGAIKGLKEFAPDERPPVPIVFFAFRIMVGAGVLMLALVVASWVLRGVRPPVLERLVSACLPTGDPARLYRRPGRLDPRPRWAGSRGRSCGLPAYGRLRHAVARCARRARLVGSIRSSVCGHLPHRFSVLSMRLVRNGPGANVASRRKALIRPVGPARQITIFRHCRIPEVCHDRVRDQFRRDLGVIILASVFLYVHAQTGLTSGSAFSRGFAPSTADSDVMMKSIAPVWDGNETWLVMGGVALLAAFPLAFAVIIPAVYCSDPRDAHSTWPFAASRSSSCFQDPGGRSFWDRAFPLRVDQWRPSPKRLVLGAFIQGFRVEGRQFAGSSFDFLTPFSVITGLALVFGHALLGAGWLIIKTDRGASGLGSPGGTSLPPRCLHRRHYGHTCGRLCTCRPWLRGGCRGRTSCLSYRSRF